MQRDAMQSASTVSDIVLIGPVGAGKSTVGRLLAQKIGVRQVSLDALCWDYYKEIGFNEQKGTGPDGMIAWQFNAHAVERMLSEHSGCVFDFGAGHSVFREEEALARVQTALSTYRNVILLLPSPDTEVSSRVLHERNAHNEWLSKFRMQRGYAPNEHFLRHPSNKKLATKVIYTLGRTPEQTCDDIMNAICVGTS